MQAFIACFSLLFDAEDVSHFCSLKERKKRFPKPAGGKTSMGLERTDKFENYKTKLGDL